MASPMTLFNSMTTDKQKSATNSDVILTPLLSVDNYRIRRYLGPIQLYFVKDSSLAAVGASSKGSLDGFMKVFANEVNTAVKAQVKALGGNALLCYAQDSMNCDGKMFRNQAYHIMSVKGDAVLLEFIEGSAPAVVDGL